MKRKEDLLEEYLAKKLFGDKAELFRDAKHNDGSSGDESEPEDNRAASDVVEQNASEGAKQAVWHDADDENVEGNARLVANRRTAHLLRDQSTKQILVGAAYEKHLRENFARSANSGIAAPKWAQPKVSKKNDGDLSDDDLRDAMNEMVASGGKCVATSHKLPKGVISMKRLSNFTRGRQIRKKAMHALQFHPTRSVLMTAGSSGVVTLYEVGKPEIEEAFLQDVYFKNFPINHAEFSPDGLRLFAASKRKEFFMSYDLHNGKTTQMRTPIEVTKMNAGSFCLSADGKYIAIMSRNEAHIVTAASFEYIGVFVAPINVVAAQFLPNDANIIYVMGENGRVFIWNITEHKLVHEFDDDGAVRGTTFQISKNGELIACGSNTGIVNLYDVNDVEQHQFPKPLKVIDNLTTSADCIAFSNDSQILAIASGIKRNAVRLLHVRSRTIFSNFPPRDVNIGNPTAIAFSPYSGYMATGDDHGFLTLFKLDHFNSY